MITDLGEEEAAQTVCGRPNNVNDFSSKAAMEASGWEFSWDDSYVFKRPANRGAFCNGVASSSYCGFKHPGAAQIGTLVFTCSCM